MSKADPRRALGQRGEELAARRLAGDGLTIVARNYRCPAGEMDLIAREGDCLVFVEVRTRGGAGWGSPEESVTPAKQARLVAVAEHYLAQQALDDVDWRIDVVAIDLEQGGFVRRLEILRDAVSRP